MAYRNISITLPEEVIAQLDKMGNRSKTILDAVNLLLTQQVYKRIRETSFMEDVREIHELAKRENPKKLSFKEIVRLKNAGRK